MIKRFPKVPICLFFLFGLMACDKNEKIKETKEPSQIELKGTGSLVYTDYEPLASSPVIVYYHVPLTADGDSPILIVFHGSNRDAEESRDELIEKANRHNIILVVPEFSDAYFPGGDAYNLGNVFVDGDNPSPSTLNEEEVWTFSLVEPIFDYMKQLTANNNATYYAFGFSAGAQFVQRFLLFKPAARTGKVVAASAGWYTMPDDQVEFPYGLKESTVTQASLNTFFSRQLTVLVGTADNDPNANGLRRSKKADQQGTNRLARAKYFYDNSLVIAAGLGNPFNWQYLTLPKVGHDFQATGEYAMDNIFTN